MTGLRPFTEETKVDAFQVVSTRFSSECCTMLEKYLNNPLRKLASAVGEVAYEGERPVGFQAAILRKLYRDSTPFIGVVGGMLAMYEGTSPVLLVNLMKATIQPRGGSILFYANTANAASMKMNRLLGVKGKGPATCERIRFTVTYWPRLLHWLLPRAVARRIISIEDGLFNDFWVHYLASNKGIVTSRTAEELRWVFGEGLANGSLVLLGLFNAEEQLQGYIILKSSHAGKRWLVVDWIALNNDLPKLKTLLASAIRYLRRETNAWALESIGFAEYSEVVQRQCLPFKRRTESNSFLWKFTTGKQEVEQESWFFGPYDGDRCM